MSQHDVTVDSNGTILIVEDDNALREALVDMLVRAGFDCHSVRNGLEALEKMDQCFFDLVLSDLQMPKMDGLTFVPKAIKKKPYLPIILMTAYGSVEKAVEAIKLGAIDFINKPFDSPALLEKINRYIPSSAVQNAPVEGESGAFAQLNTQCSFVTQSPPMLEALNLANKVSRSQATVLITGPSGTGKEVISRFIHAQSDRSEAPFVAVNCAAIPENMLEAILFGYEKGAFTGAQTAMPGKFEQANHGTLLLDEITEMPLSLQSKLLRVLQEKEVERLGSKKTLKLDVRVLATSNRNLAQAVAQQQFREDLFYRLNVFPIVLPGLQERRCDIVPLAEFLLAKHANGPLLRFSQEAAEALLSHSWSGNVRELENVVQRAIILTEGDVISPDVLLLELGQTGEGINSTQLVSSPTGFLDSPHSAGANVSIPDPAKSATAGDDLQVFSSSHSTLSSNVNASNGVHSSSEQDRHPDAQEVSLGDTLRCEENRIIIDVLKQTGGSRKAAAEQLGISTRTLRYKLARIKALGVNLSEVLEA